MGIARSTYYDQPTIAVSDTELVSRFRQVTNGRQSMQAPIILLENELREQLACCERIIAGELAKPGDHRTPQII
jgi:hypothetical protein